MLHSQPLEHLVDIRAAKVSAGSQPGDCISSISVVYDYVFDIIKLHALSDVGVDFDEVGHSVFFKGMKEVLEPFKGLRFSGDPVICYRICER